ncbi:ABC-type multidrug transport system, ATPase component [Salinarchaeum sp. Harcht-Bsk1]|uniref:ABC transporter ATP-binding protein n=1 Tax=Salinarchaeum sp. Harcht-Bsk1 TaxID=1333523 RepID=UPI0003424213|nr:ABC transporter ATP-binding protein [Salinarchaeum sp. Harcht-Bsk1]AGN00272.1 ABC-type multidrug transport system, ATPase component [Salinarchaeum sp. Harcht-Bsk1]
MPAIETNGLSKTYGESVTALQDLDLTVEYGDVYGFLGPNGAGKSTTINLLLDFIHPTDGSAEVLGYDTRTDSLQIRENIGILPEGAEPYDRLTGREHVEFAMESKDVDGDVDAVLDRVGLSGEDADRRAGGYSKGMAQRLGLGMALVGDPDLLILDEPSTGLDPAGMAEMRDLIREEAADGTAVFFSSHILDEVEEVCDRVAILNEGRLVADDDLDELREEFTGECDVTLDVAEPPAGGVDLAPVDGVVETAVEDDAIIVTCEHPRVKADVVRYVDDHHDVTDVISEETSLESMFERYTNGSVEESDSAADGATSEAAEPAEVAR